MGFGAPVPILPWFLVQLVFQNRYHQVQKPCIPFCPGVKNWLPPVVLFWCFLIFLIRKYLKNTIKKSKHEVAKKFVKLDFHIIFIVRPPFPPSPPPACLGWSILSSTSPSQRHPVW
jgi:hypothetical protein